MPVRLFVAAGHVSLVCAAAGLDARRPLEVGGLVPLSGRYASAREAGAGDGSASAAMLEVGRALWRWLDGAEGWLGRLWPVLPCPFVLEVEAPAVPDGPG